MNEVGSALKEWNAQVLALEAGEVALVVRKGGIVERRNEFMLEHKQFLLYPTFLHQNEGELQARFSRHLGADPQPGRVRLRSFAVVERVWKIEDSQLLVRLEPEQCLNLAVLERRFAYRSQAWVHALLLRVYRLEQPLAFKETAAQRGCVSWVPFEPVLSLPALQPVLSETLFAQHTARITDLLG